MDAPTEIPLRMDGADTASTATRRGWRWWCWGGFMGAVYAVSLTPPALLFSYVLGGLLYHILQCRYWIWENPSPLLDALPLGVRIGVSVGTVLLMPLRFLPNHPLPTLKKVGYWAVVAVVVVFVMAVFTPGCGIAFY